MAQYPELTPNDRADIVCRVFDQKVIEFIKFLKEVKTFGYICAVLYTIEFQKRGLPHCHTLLWVDSKSELQDAQHIDEFIFAEILDPVKDSRGYKLVTELMMHRPCGSANSSASCTEDPIKLWIKHWEAMSDDIPAKISKVTRIPNYYVNTAELKGYILYELEAVLNGFGKSIIDFGLPLPPKHLLKDLENKLLMEEKDYKRDLLKQEAAESVPKLNHDKKKVYDIIMGASLANQQELLFLYGHGGTRKTFLWKIVITSLRAEGNDEIGEPDEEDAHDSSWITIPPGYLVTADETWLSQLIDFIYDDTTLRKPTAETFKTYLSNDQAIPIGKETSETELLYPMEYLNIITFPGLLPHELELKVGSPIMLLRNVNLSSGLCNGTRMIVGTLMSKLIEAQIITGRRVGDKATRENVADYYFSIENWTTKLHIRSQATKYDSTDESLVCNTSLPLLEKLAGAEPVFGPKTIKSILKSNSIFKAETLKGVTINEPTLAPAKGNKNVSASKKNSALAGKLKNVKLKMTFLCLL
ncbi:DNA helicase [Tanacetum coccineum]